MHVVSLLRSSMFDVSVAGRPGTIDDVFPEWREHDRFGIVIDGPLGGLGATHLIQVAITSFYDVKEMRRTRRPIYPEIYAFHVGRGQGAHAPFDFWPQRREKIVTGDHRDLLDAINDCAVTRLAVPEGRVGRGSHRPKEEDAALDRIVTAVAYSPAGRVAAPDVAIRGNDRRTEYNPSRVLRPVVPDGAASPAASLPVKEADESYRAWLLARAGDVDEADRRAAEARRDVLRDAAGLVEESYRLISADEALRRL
jgi:hypothetical protein